MNAVPTNPAVTVVVIVYNDAARLPTAVASVLEQTLSSLEVVIVDDASTDSSAAVAAGLAARDSRVRVVRLDANSGGCSRPRNVGIDNATAPYVMFLDSDDTLERHACKNLLFAAVNDDADVASGLCVRVNVSNRVGRDRQPRRTPWMPWLYDERATYRSIRERPDLLFDSLSTNKLYRRAFLDEQAIRFPEGLHYEDLLFSMEAYCSARAISIIPEKVYRWVVDEDAEEVSISRRLAQIQNFRDRLTIHQRIDAYLSRTGHDDLKPFKDRKFIRSDLKLYLCSLAERDEAYQAEWLPLAAAYLDTLHPHAWEICGRIPRAAAYLVRQGDLDAAIKVATFWNTGKLAIDLEVQDGRAFLGSRHLDDDAGRAALDVTSMHLHTAPHSRANLYTRLARLEANGRLLRLTGVTQNLLGRIRPDDAASVVLSLRNRGSKLRVDLPATLTVDDTALRWTAAVDASRLPVTPAARSSWDVVVLVSWRGAVNESTVTATAADVADVAVRTNLQQTLRAGSRLRPALSAQGDVLLRLEHGGRVGSNWGKVVRYVPRTAVARRWRAVRGFTSRRRVRRLVYSHVLQRLPTSPERIVFEAHLGRIYGDSPKYVYEALRAAGWSGRAVWSATGDLSKWPADAVVVKRDSWRYYYELSRARTWVDNQGLPSFVRPGSSTTYLQTWHGSPLKAMGLDEPRFEFGSPARRAEFVSAVKRWTHFMVQSPFAEDAFARSFPMRADMVRTGYPRNDPLHGASTAEAQAELRRRFELPTDRKVVLYTPTFRDYQRRLRQPYKLALNLEKLAEDVGDEWFVLVRAHYLDRVSISGRISSFARNVADHHDVTELMLASDALITDYSSIMFDYAILRRPMLFFAYDYDLYRLSRGTYFDLEEVAPGPVVADQDEIVTWLQTMDEQRPVYADRYEAFLKKFCTFEDGNASAAAARIVMDRLGPRSG